jgi:16S rRNA processing protein RimM
VPAVSAVPQKWVTLGRVSGVFGVKGWIKVESYTEPPGNIVTFGRWTLRLRGDDRAFEIERGHEHGGGVVAKLRGIDDRDRARDCVGADVIVERERLPAVATGEYYWTDLEGLEVRTTAGVVLGTVERLFATGAHDVVVVAGTPERLIPFVIGPVVKRIDLEAGLIEVDWSPDY